MQLYRLLRYLTAPDGNCRALAEFESSNPPPAGRRNRMALLSTTERDALPDTAFGLPEQRAYPMPDAAHARDAKARAAQEFNRGRLTAAEKARIDRKADAVLQG
jgi:hypothetical protein